MQFLIKFYYVALRLSLFSIILFIPDSYAGQLDSIAAIVNDTVITQSQLQHEVIMVKQQAAAAHAALPPDNLLRKQVLETLINEELQLDYAKTLGINISNQQVNHAIENLAKQHNLTSAQLRQMLSQQGLSVSQYQEQIRKQMLISAARQQALSGQITISEQEVDAILKQMHKSASPQLSEQAKQFIFQRKLNEAAQNWLQQLRANAYIQRN